MLACDAVVPKRRIVTPTGKAVTLAPVRPNLGVEAAYRKRLDALLDEMQASLVYWLKAGYRANEPEMLAEDISPAAAMRGIFRRLARRWQKRFDTLAPELAAYFATSVKDRSDFALKAALKKGGMTVEWRMTAPMNDAYQAVIGEQVGLIRSIASAHLTQVETLVMQSVQRGRDLGGLAEQLETQFGVTKRRAALISRDQNNKATATLTRVRQLELGIQMARWQHSSGGRHPRASHIAATGQRYEIAKGMLIDGEWILPGEKINCRCVSRAIIEGFD
jgi:uncharacterized protein with gpF-like domain